MSWDYIVSNFHDFNALCRKVLVKWQGNYNFVHTTRKIKEERIPKNHGEFLIHKSTIQCNLATTKSKNKQKKQWLDAISQISYDEDEEEPENLADPSFFHDVQDPFEDYNF